MNKDDDKFSEFLKANFNKQKVFLLFAIFFMTFSMGHYITRSLTVGFLIALGITSLVALQDFIKKKK